MSLFKSAQHSCAYSTLYLAISAALNPAFAGEDSRHHTHSDVQIPAVSITANPLGNENDALVTPVSTLNGRELSLQRESTLGDTLSNTPGVSATKFGPNASRPIIRGLDGERVKIMQNGVSVLDAASLSFDHAVAIDPLVIEQIDVVRGPAALLYGGNAVGGVVNATDFRVPQEKLNGITGRAEMRFGGADDTRNGVGVLDVGNGKFAIHADGYARKTDDLNIPGFAVSRRLNARDGTLRENKGKLANSGAESDGGALGAAWTFENGYLGASFSGLNNNYGVVAEENVRIDMRSQRWDIAGEIKDLAGLARGAKFRVAHTRYQHQELEGSTVGTTFKNRGLEGSFEMQHAPIAGLNGVVGVQMSNTNFAALGEEAFVPNVNTQNQALYMYEELPLNGFELPKKLSFGARFGRTQIDSKADDKFGAGQNNRFNPNSIAFGGLFGLTQNWSLATNFSHNERPPSYFELYANGAHVATGQFEVGNASFNKERSSGADLQLRWRHDNHHLNIGAFYTQFSNFIGLFKSGNTRGADGELNPIDADNNNVADGSGENILPEARFGQVPAVFKGAEMDGAFSLNEHLQLNVRGDYVHATNRRNGEYLPRIVPLRLGAGLQYQAGNLGARINVLHAFKQSKVAENELQTNGYSDVSAMATYKLGQLFQTKAFNLEAFVRANNLLNEEIRDHASFLKDIAPAGERSLTLGLRADF